MHLLGVGLSLRDGCVEQLKSVKQKYRSNQYMDGCTKMFLSIYKCVPSIMALTHRRTEKYHKVSEAYHKISEAKILSEGIHG